MNSYYNTHKKRYETTLDIIREYKLLKNGNRVLSLGPCESLKHMILNEFKVKIDETDCDLRYEIKNQEKYNLVLCLEVIEHIKDRESSDTNCLSTFTGSGIKSLISESYRLLNEGGYFLLSTPNIHCYKTLYNWFNKDDLLTYSLHPRELSEKYLTLELEKYYQDIKILYRNSWQCHGTPSDFIGFVEDFMKNNNLSTDNRFEDNLFLICKK